MLEKQFDFLRVKAKLVLRKGAKLFATLPNGTEQRLPVPTARTLAAATTLTADDNGATLFLASATEFAVTLPAPVAGMQFNFIVGAAPSGASYTVVTSGSANVMLGHVLTSDIDGAADGDSETSGGDTLSFVDGVAVVGDRASLVSDGTSWFVQASCKTYNAITVTTAS